MKTWGGTHQCARVRWRSQAHSSSSSRPMPPQPRRGVCHTSMPARPRPLQRQAPKGSPSWIGVGPSGSMMETDGRTLGSPARFPSARRPAPYGAAQQRLNPVGPRRAAHVTTALSIREVRDAGLRRRPRYRGGAALAGRTERPQGSPSRCRAPYTIFARRRREKLAASSAATIGTIANSAAE
jgi:hypothetical protein